MHCIMRKQVRKMWKKVDVVFKLRSPLHIGYTPFKGFVISPTRYYVPGRNFWGAITKRITEYLYEKPEPWNYKKIGGQIMESFRFSYFYIYDGRVVYFPRYTKQGLRYGNNSEEVTKSEFEHRFIGSFISTEIDSFSRTAKSGSLHELEFINNKTRDENGNLKDVKIAGCIWIKEGTKIENKEIILDNKGILVEDFNAIDKLVLGGESKYGFGHVVLDSINQVVFPEYPPFRWKGPENVKIIHGEFLPAHLKYSESLNFKGDIELLTGRGYYDPNVLKKGGNKSKKDKAGGNDSPGAVISIPEYYFAPGTVVIDGGEFKVEWDGTLEVRKNGK